MKRVVGSALYFASVGGFGILCVVWAVVSIFRGDIPSAVVVLGLAIVSFGLTAPLVLIFSGKVKPCGEFDGDGTLVHPDRIVDRLFGASSLGALMAMIAYAIFAPLGKVNIPLPPGNRQLFFYLSVAGSLWGLVNLRKLVQRGGTSYLRLAADEFELGQGWAAIRGDWVDIADISDRREGHSPPVRGSIFVIFKDGHVRTLAADAYTPGGNALRRWMRFYWQNSKCRGELTDNRALKRLDNEDFLAV